MVTRLGIIGTSWWVDSMYLPALSTLEDTQVVAIAGRDLERARQRADQWSIPTAYDNWEAMLEHEELDGLIVAAANPIHYPATKAGLEAGLHVLCEKPVASGHAEARQLADLARAIGATTMVPFTYAFMPGFRWMERLVGEGYVGRIHHVGLRYHTGYGMTGDYLWKLDARHNPTGALGDIGSHFFHLAVRLAGPVEAVTARLDTLGSRPTVDSSGTPYPPAADSAVVIMEFTSGAHGVLHASAVSYEGTSMNQRHEIDVHGADGHLRYVVDWDEVQIVSGTKAGQGPPRELPIPDEIWGNLRREQVHDTYRDVFRTTDAMARGWVKAMQRGATIEPDLSAGADVQLLLDASLRSSERQQRVALAAVT